MTRELSRAVLVLVLLASGCAAPSATTSPLAPATASTASDSFAHSPRTAERKASVQGAGPAKVRQVSLDRSILSAQDAPGNQPDAQPAQPNAQPDGRQGNPEAGQPAMGGKMEEVAVPEVGTRVDLDSLLAMALENNPSIAQAHAAICKAVGIRLQVGLKPNPSIGYFGQEIGNDGAAGQQGAFVSQTLVRGDKLRWNRAVLSRDVQALQWQLATQRQRVETDVRLQFFRALAAQQKVERARDFRRAADAAAKLAKQRYEAAEGSLPDLLQSEMLVDQVDLSIRSSELEWQAAWGELAATVGLGSLAPTQLAGDFPQPQIPAEPQNDDALSDEIAMQSPLIAAAAARVERARLNLQRQRNQVIPNVNAQAGVAYDESSGDTFANLQLALPLPVHNKNQGNIAAAQAQYSLAVRELQRLRMLMRRQLAGAMQRLRTADATVAKYQQALLPKAERSLQLVEEAQAAGEANFLRVLTARQVTFELGQKLVAAQADLAQAEAEIDGLLLTDALGTGVQFAGNDGLRGQALSGQ